MNLSVVPFVFPGKQLPGRGRAEGKLKIMRGAVTKANGQKPRKKQEVQGKVFWVKLKYPSQQKKVNNATSGFAVN